MLISVVGAFLVAPDAAKRLVTRGRTRVATVSRQAGQYLGLLAHPQVHQVVVTDTIGTGSAIGTVTVTGSAAGGPPPTVPEQVLQLQASIAEINELLTRTREEMDANRSGIERALAEAGEDLQQRLATLVQRVDDADHMAVETDARALPVVGVGVILSGLSPELARLPIVAGLLMVISVAFAGRAYLDARRDRRDRAVKA